MIIVAGGDSIIWGSELKDSPHGGPNGYSRRTFPALLSSENYICAAYPGIGNREIARRVIDAVEQLIFTNIPQMVLVCWTWPTRDNAVDSDDIIIELQQYLNLHSIPYLFTCVDNCIINNNSKIHWDNWYLFPAGTKVNETSTPRGFYQWAIENKYNMGTDGHPLESAHQDAVILIKEKFDEVVKKHLQSY
jgi:hypothetical protein